MTTKIVYHMEVENRIRRGELGSVRTDILARAHRVAAAAGPGFDVDSGIVTSGRRFRAAVFTATYEARAAEADGLALTQAIDAAR